MALILEGRATLLECHGCGELYLEGEGPNRSSPGAVAAWRERHLACPPPAQALRAAAPKMQADIEALVLPRLLELGAEAAHTWEPLPSGAARIAEREAAVQRAATDVVRELVQKLELGLLPGRLEQAARTIHDLQGTVERLDEQSREIRELVGKTLPGHDLAPLTLLGVVSEATDEVAMLQRILCEPGPGPHLGLRRPRRAALPRR
jgi:hypothetical protein